jgi:hypothetical protein
MKTVQTNIGNNDTKQDWCKIKCVTVRQLDNDIWQLMQWADREDTVLPEWAYHIIDNLKIYFEQEFRKL